jgi:nucleotidyltransferase/DNA polymerase involved in DNA repair
MVAATLGATGLKAASSERLDFSAIKKLLSRKGVNLSDEKIKLYDKFDVDFERSEDLEDVYDIQAVKGISPKSAEKFRDLGIKTTSDLVKNLENNYEDIDFIAKKLEVSSEDITSWISRANILRLPGVSAKEAQLIQTVGISSVRELGVVNIHSLHKEMVELNKKSEIVNEVPGINSLELWSKVAKLLV